MTSDSREARQYGPLVPHETDPRYRGLAPIPVKR